MLNRRINGAVALAAATAALALAAPPTPESHFGHPIGVDRKLLDWDKVVSYFQGLGKTSDRVVVKELGKTVDNRPFIAAWISSAANIKNLDRYRQIQERLADPRKTPPEEAQKLIQEGKTVVLITCSIHATEVASTHTAIEFVYKLITDDDPKFKAILDNTIFILVPSQNPDGVDIVTQWYRRSLGSKWEGTSPPELYHKYVGHDNNRDWYIFSQPETRHTISQIHNVWHPQVVYDVHQQGAYASRMFVPPWMDPVEPNIDPIITQLCNAVGMQMAADLTAAGKTGVAVNAMYDFWTPARHYQAYHAGLRILSESASAQLATPITVRPEQISGNALGYDPRKSSWNHLEPWKGGEWKLRDIIDYQFIAFKSLLYQAAVKREDMLRAFYEVGVRAVARKTPYAFVIPLNQFNPGGAEKLLDTLTFGQVEVDISDDDFQAGGKTYPKGSYVVRMQQPYGSWAKALLERQEYPDLRLYPGGPPKRPYDVTAHTLPLLMGVEVATIPVSFSAKLRTVKNFSLPRAGGGAFLPAADVTSWKALTGALATSPGAFRDTATGNFAFTQGADRKYFERPRIGIYKSHVPSMDEGWTRWILEQFGFQYASPDNGEINGDELQRLDVIIFPDQNEATIVNGYPQGAMPQQYMGGIGSSGDANLKKFVTNGGTLVFLNHSTDYAVNHLGLNVKNVVRGLSNREFYSPGSILNSSIVDPKHPLAFGMQPNIFIWSEGSPAWEVPEGSGRVVARYPDAKVLASGWLLGEKHIAGKASVVDVPLGKGHVVLFGMRPQYRAQSYETLKMLFNAFLLR